MPTRDQIVRGFTDLYVAMAMFCSGWSGSGRLVNVNPGRPASLAQILKPSAPKGAPGPPLTEIVRVQSPVHTAIRHSSESEAPSQAITAVGAEGPWRERRAHWSAC
jgi:hypothetical protein